MRVVSVTKYKVVKAFTIFDILFFKGDTVHISEMENNSSYCCTFNRVRDFVGKMHEDYFRDLKCKNYIEEDK